MVTFFHSNESAEMTGRVLGHENWWLLIVTPAQSVMRYLLTPMCRERVIR